MIFTVRRASYFPIILEPEEQHTLETLDEQGRWVELEDYEETLRKSDNLKEISVQTEKYEELILFLDSINHKGPITINFEKKTIVIEDNGEVVQ